ncbi:MAG: TIGR02270 family protein [Granulosicoccus sp.]|nr:TIGR02270 family protein [Granulosicoccus sp.]
MNAIVESVIYQHAENVCSLWLQRQHAVEEPHYSFTDIVHLDNRLDANLEGLRVAGSHALTFIDEMMDAGDEGACFAKALLSLEAGDRKTFSELIELAGAPDSNHQLLKELESALAWAKPEYLKESVKALLSATDSASIILGLRTCASHNRDPGVFLDTHFRSNDPAVRAAVINVAADRAIVEFRHRLSNSVASDTELEQYERGRALAMFGEQQKAREILQALALGDSSFNSSATALVMLLDDANASRSLLKKLDALPERERDVVRGFGLIGDPGAMDWLIAKTSIPVLSRLSGGAITMISGIDLADADLETLQAPDGFEDGGLNDSPEDDNVDLDEDEDLPWPDPELVAAWWNSSPKLPAGKRFLDGREKIQAELMHVLRHGMQRQRNAAAMSLALLKPESPYLDTRLPTNKQRAWVS